MQINYLKLNQRISIIGDECEIEKITTLASGGRKYAAASINTNIKYAIIQENDGSITSIIRD